MGAAGVPGAQDVRGSAQLSAAQLQYVASRIERLHRRNYGRESGSARALQSDNLLTVVLSGVVTPDERFLIGRGRVDLVTGFHVAFQKSMRPQFVEEVQRAIGLEVRAVSTSVDVELDRATETFFLATESSCRFARA